VIEEGSISLALESQRTAIPVAHFLGVTRFYFERFDLADDVKIALDDRGTRCLRGLCGSVTGAIASGEGDDLAISGNVDRKAALAQPAYLAADAFFETLADELETLRQEGCAGFRVHA